MTLLIGSPGLVRDGIAKALSPKGGAVVIEPDHDDPFGAAVDHEAIVYVPASSLTVGGPDSSPEIGRASCRERV